MAQLYKKPPIVEAVIEVQTAPPTTSDLLDRAKNRLVENYPLAAPHILVDVEVADATASIPPKVRQQLQGYRLTASDGAGVLSISPNFIATSRLAPYEGWEPFFARSRQNWDIWKRIVGRREFTRIGVRYINRIDIPAGGPIEVEDYLLFSPKLPNTLPSQPMSSFAVNAALPLEFEGFTLILNAGSAPSPLVKGYSVLLDFDISRTQNLPRNDEDLWSLIAGVRGPKNAIFEACITDKARELFNK